MTERQRERTGTDDYIAMEDIDNHSNTMEGIMENEDDDHLQKIEPQDCKIQDIERVLFLNMTQYLNSNNNNQHVNGNMSSEQILPNELEKNYPTDPNYLRFQDNESNKPHSSSNYYQNQPIQTQPPQVHKQQNQHKESQDEIPDLQIPTGEFEDQPNNNNPNQLNQFTLLENQRIENPNLNIFAQQHSLLQTAHDDYNLNENLSHNSDTRDSEGSQKEKSGKKPNKKPRKGSTQSRTRNREKTVGYVCNYIQKWRDYYENGVLDETGQLKKLNLTQAAQRLGLPRKTLDDYHGQIKKGQATGFDFEANWNKPIGALRSHNKMNKSKNSIDQTDFLEHEQNLQNNLPDYQEEVNINNNPFSLKNPITHEKTHTNTNQNQNQTQTNLHYSNHSNLSNVSNSTNLSRTSNNNSPVQIQNNSFVNYTMQPYTSNPYRINSIDPKTNHGVIMKNFPATSHDLIQNSN